MRPSIYAIVWFLTLPVFVVLTSGLAAESLHTPSPVMSSSDIHDTYFPKLSSSDYRTLMTEGELSSFFNREVELRLAPRLPVVDDVTQSLKDLEPRIGVEVLFYIPTERTPSEAFTRDLYNALRSVSTMEGIEYYSASRNRMRIFYIESYAVAGPEDRTAVPDPLVHTVPTRDTVHVFQRDSSFGRNTYSVEYYADRHSITMTARNLTTMFYSIVPMVGPENFETHIIVIPSDEGVFFYGVSGVSVITTLGFENKARASFYNRIKAMHRWFTTYNPDLFHK
jgi:hypothetical protein